MRRLLIALCAGAVVLTVAGCQRAGEGGGGGGETGGNGESGITTEAVQGIIEDWTASRHAVPIVFAAEEEDCVLCHDARAFAQGISNPTSLDATFGAYVVATDCRACHTGAALEVLRSGETTLVTTSTPVQAGTGSLCLRCHRDRRPPNVQDERRSAPHASVQGGVWTGTTGIRSAAMQVGSTRRHVSIRNGCVACHMTEKDGVASHTFEPGDARTICARCHEGATDYDLEAGGDYDGDGSPEIFQQEVEGLLTLVSTTAAREMQATEVTATGGRIVFMNGETTVTASIPDDVYTAAFNWAAIEHDGSRGIHNPQFTVDLLQESYRVLTGNAIPNAAKFGAEGEAATGTPEATGAPGATESPGATETTP